MCKKGMINVALRKSIIREGCKFRFEGKKKFIGGHKNFNKIKDHLEYML